MLKLSVEVKPGSKFDKLEFTGKRSLKAHLKAPPVDGKANASLIKSLSKKTGFPQSAFQIKSGQNSKKKILVVDIDEGKWEEKMKWLKIQV